MRPKAWMLLMAALTLGAAPAQAQWGFGFDDREEWSVTLSGARLDQELEGHFRWGEAVANTALDVESVLDLGDSQSFAGRIYFQPGKAYLRLGFVPLDFSGDALLTVSQRVDGVVYGVGDRVSTELELDSYELAFGYQLRLGHRLMIAPLIEVVVLDGFADTIDLDLPGSRVAEQFVVPIALAGLRVEAYPLPRLELFAEAKGFVAGSWGELEDATVVDGELGLSLRLTRHALLTASYRLRRYEFDVSSMETDLELSGLSLSVDFRF